MQNNDRVSHPYDMTWSSGDDVVVLDRTKFFLENAMAENKLDTYGTLGTAGTWGGTFGTFATAACCC